MWTKKYSPDLLDEFVGNGKAVRETTEWIERWKKGALIIHGPPGCGKTTFVQLLSKHLGYFLVDTNASDVRGAKALKEEFNMVVQQQSLFFKGRIILFDEIDGLSAGDRGAVPEMLKIIELTKYPIILVANDVYLPKLRPLRNKCTLIKFNKIRKPTTEKILKGICDKENIKFEDNAIKFISNSSNGDLKAAINDLQGMVGKNSALEYDKIVDLGYRDIERKIFDSLKIILKTETARTAEEAINTTDKSLDETFQWIRENLPLEYTKKEDLANAYNMLSRADVFRGRISRQQYWGYLSYFSQLMSIGVSLSKKEKYNKFVMYRYPSKIMYMGKSKAARAKEKELLDGLGKHLHCSRKVARNYIPLLNLMQKHNQEDYEKIE